MNKRTGRLSCNIPLLKAGLPPISFVGVSDKEYKGGLLSFYETCCSDKISEVFTRCCIDSNKRYFLEYKNRVYPSRVGLIRRISQYWMVSYHLCMMPYAPEYGFLKI